MENMQKQAVEFFKNLDWGIFYQEKMALQETIELLRYEDSPKYQNAAKWLDGIVNMMDAMGDTGEQLGLFTYPERDENDRCFDERFNDVLLKDPEHEQQK